MKVKKSIALLLIILVAGVYVIAPVAAADSGTISGTFQSTAGPEILSITPNTGVANPTPDGETPYNVIVRVRDADGNADITEVYASLQNSSWNGNMPDTETAVSGFVPVDAYTIDVSFTLHFQYYDEPGSYSIAAAAKDSKGLSAAQLVSGEITYNSAIGLTLDGPTALDFGTLTYNSTSAQRDSTIHNSANTIIYVWGTAPDWSSNAGGSSVPASTLYAEGFPMNGNDYIVKLLVLETPTPLGFVEHVPVKSGSFTLVGNYTTTITLTATSSANPP